MLDAAGNPREFLGNVDSESVKKNLFDNPINAQYMKIQPTKWSGGIELKLEPIGCYLPYRKNYFKQNFWVIFEKYFSLS